MSEGVQVVGELGIGLEDTGLESVTLSYDDVLLVLTPQDWVTPPALIYIRCVGYLGIQDVGMWDDNGVDGAVLHDDHPFARDCVTAVRSRNGPNPPTSGTPERGLDNVSTLELRMGDGRPFLVAANDFIVSRGTLDPGRQPEADLPAGLRAELLVDAIGLYLGLLSPECDPHAELRADREQRHVAIRWHDSSAGIHFRLDSSDQRPVEVIARELVRNEVHRHRREDHADPD